MFLYYCEGMLTAQENVVQQVTNLLVSDIIAQVRTHDQRKDEKVTNRTGRDAVQRE